MGLYIRPAAGESSFDLAARVRALPSYNSLSVKDWLRYTGPDARIAIVRNEIFIAVGIAYDSREAIGFARATLCGTETRPVLWAVVAYEDLASIDPATIEMVWELQRTAAGAAAATANEEVGNV